MSVEEEWLFVLFGICQGNDVQQNRTKRNADVIHRIQGQFMICTSF